ncbi:hypothetical protein BDV12DRAFT_192253 [Aspergillus spectabilis]
MESGTTPSKVVEVEGELFDAPDGAALIRELYAILHQRRNSTVSSQAYFHLIQTHAIALEAGYPAAYKVYQAHCDYYLEQPQFLDTSNATVSTGPITRKVQRPEGTALVIPPQKSDYEGPDGMRHWIICLFTSRGVGRKVSSADVVLENTELAIADLKIQLDMLRSGDLGPDVVGIKEIWSCRFNSGLFKVDWKYSKSILEGSGLEATVVRPPEEE